MTVAGPRVALAPARHVLDNGVTLLVKSAATTPAVTIDCTFEAGSLYDPPERLGLAAFLARVIDRGTARRPADAVAELFDARGVSPSVSVTRHAFGFSCDCLAEDFETILDLMGEIIMSPAVPDDEVATRRGEAVTAIRQAEDSPAIQAFERLMALLYGADHPYGRKTTGTVETVERIDRDALVRFHRERLVPAALSLAIVGDVDAGAARDAVARILGGWRTSGAPPVTLGAPPPATTRRREIFQMPDKAQADITYGFTTIRRADPAYYAYRLMTSVFGQYGMGGRLGQSIRERQGMAYYASASFEASRIAGPLIVRAGVSAANVDRAIASIDAEVTRMRTDGVTEEELADAKRYLIGSLPRTLETNAGIAGFLQNVERFDLGLDYELRLPDLVDAVGRDAVNAAADATLRPDHAALVVAGPYREAAGGEGG